VQGVNVVTDTEIYTEIQKFHRILESFCVVFRTTAPPPTASEIVGKGTTSEGAVEKDAEVLQKGEEKIEEIICCLRPEKQRIVVITHPGGNPNHVRIHTGKGTAAS